MMASQSKVGRASGAGRWVGAGPVGGEPIGGRQVERGGLLVVQRDNAGFPVEQRDFAALLASALEREFIRLQTGGSDRAMAFETALSGIQQRGQSAQFADGRNAVLVPRVLEAVGGVADHESARAEKALVDKIHAGRQRLVGFR